MLGRFAETDSTRELLASARMLSIQLATMFLLAGLMVDHLLEQRYQETAHVYYWISLLLAGVPILRSAVRGLAEGHAHADELVAIAILAALSANFFPGVDAPMLMEAAEVAVIMQLATLVEEWASSTAHKSILSLESLIPKRVMLMIGDQASEKDISEVRVGDVLLVRPGDRVGADGKIVEGETALNQAAITGESLPVERGVGAAVFAGSINQGNGTLKIKVEHVQADSTLGRIVKMIRTGEAFQPSIVLTADSFFNYYTPLILVLAGIAFWLNDGPDTEQKKQAVEAAIAVLVVGCPCPLLLASPMAILAGLSRAAKTGIAIKAGSFLEAVGQVRMVIFDKTGTLTTGQIRLISVEVPTPAGGEGMGNLAVDRLAAQQELLRLAAAAESRSSHPLAQAILREARNRGVAVAEPISFEQIGGLGIRAEVAAPAGKDKPTERLLLGSRRMMETELGADRFAEQLGSLGLAANDPALQVFAAVGGKLAGCLRLEDTVREDAAEVITKLRARGIERFALLTGDRREVAQTVAARVGITEVFADLLPADKIAKIRELQAAGLKVVMVGDGVNDAPALSAADVGIAVGDTATDVALEAANAAILSGSLRPLPFFLAISRATVETIRWNLLGVAITNTLFILVSMTGIVPAGLAAILHVVASVAVILNSLRLNAFSETPTLPPPVAGSGTSPSGGSTGGGSGTAAPATVPALSPTMSPSPSAATVLSGSTLSFGRL